MIEQTWHFPPRRLVEIQDAISKLIDQVWYNRHQVWNEKLQSGEAKLINNDEERGKDRRYRTFLPSGARSLRRDPRLRGGCAGRKDRLATIGRRLANGQNLTLESRRSGGDAIAPNFRFRAGSQL
jgi:hypothetical protein